MKKLALTTVCALAVSSAAFAQGTLTWNAFGGNFVADTNSTQISPLFGGAATGSGNVGPTVGAGSQLFYYELLYTSYNGVQLASPTTLVGLRTWQDVGLTATNSLAANGRINPINANVQASTPATWNNGTTNSIMLVGWSANLGTSWLVVSNELATQTTFAAGSFFGESVTGYINPGPSGSPGPTIFNASPNANGLPINNIATPAQLFLLPSVPEPATMALMGLGGLSLLLFRRSRKS